jgi:hypothetical protein
MLLLLAKKTATIIGQIMIFAENLSGLLAESLLTLSPNVDENILRFPG